jgi:hypothetical protein
MAKTLYAYCRKCPAATDHQHIIHTIPGRKRKVHRDAVWCPLRREMRGLGAAEGCEWDEDGLLARREELTHSIAAIDDMLPKCTDWYAEQEARDHA